MLRRAVLVAALGKFLQEKAFVQKKKVLSTLFSETETASCAKDVPVGARRLWVSIADKSLLERRKNFIDLILSF